MATIAFLPVRGGSQSIPLKNIKEINSHPLIYWTLLSLEESDEIHQVIVATDCDEIKKTALSFNFRKVAIYNRLPENAQHTSSTESVILEYISQSKLKLNDVFVLVQATNPFTTPIDFTESIKSFKKSKKYKSALSVVKTKRFLWTLDNRPLNYNPLKRPRRQDYSGLFMENGAFYISRVKDILKSKNRLTKPIMTFEMPEHTGFEIDEPDDWIICENLLRKHRPLNQKKKKVKLLLSDVDGVLTDAGMYYSENGDELKKFCTYDGMAFKLFKESGVQVGILTQEDRVLNRNRAKKLKLDFDFHGIQNKLETLLDLTKKLNISLDEVAYVGDDINDTEVLKHVGYAFCPSNAQPEIKSLPNIQILKSAGGQGVIREIFRIINPDNP